MKAYVARDRSGLLNCFLNTPPRRCPMLGYWRQKGRKMSFPIAPEDETTETLSIGWNDEPKMVMLTMKIR